MAADSAAMAERFQEQATEARERSSMGDSFPPLPTEPSIQSLHRQDSNRRQHSEKMTIVDEGGSGTVALAEKGRNKWLEPRVKRVRSSTDLGVS
eukprot:c14200_g1_i2 orf=243-524(-)